MIDCLVKYKEVIGIFGIVILLVSIRSYSFKPDAKAMNNNPIVTMKIIDIVTKYTIIKSHSSESLSAAVDRAIQNGWQPQGRSYIYGDVFFQTMVKKISKRNFQEEEYRS